MAGFEEFRRAFLLGAAAAATALGSSVAAETLTFGDWSLSLDESDGLAICAALIGGDGGPSLDVYFDETMAKPPNGYPLVTFWEGDKPEAASQLKPGETIVIDSLGQGAVSAPITDEYSEGNVPYATVGFDKTVAVLRTMTVGTVVRVLLPDRTDPLWTGSLDGFAEVYAKMAEHCDFDAAGVLR